MQTYSRDDIIARCLIATQDELLDGQPYGNKVLRLDEQRAVKFGLHLSEREGHNQAAAYALLDRNLLRVPQVYDYFQDDEGRGYLVMEFMSGYKSATMTEDYQVKALAAILQHFATHTSESPGPLSNGPSEALIFGELDYPHFESGNHLDDWFSHRLLEPGNKISISRFGLVLCHLDLFPRNILWHEKEVPAILDWGTAGYYPQILERCTYRTIGSGEDERLFPPLQPDEAEQMQLVLKAWSNIIRFTFSKQRHQLPDIGGDPNQVIPVYSTPSASDKSMTS